MYRVADVIYIPFNPNDIEVMKSRTELKKSFIYDGWIYVGSAHLKDNSTGDTINVFVLTKY